VIPGIIDERGEKKKEKENQPILTKILSPPPPRRGRKGAYQEGNACLPRRLEKKERGEKGENRTAIKLVSSPVEHRGEGGGKGKKREERDVSCPNS